MGKGSGKKSMKDAFDMYLSDNNWKYTFDEERNLFVTGLNYGGVVGNVRIFINVLDNDFFVFFIPNSKAEENSKAIVAEYLHRVNYGLWNGNFEMDYDDGEVRYKIYRNMYNDELSDEVIENSLMTGASMINRYGKGLIKVMSGMGIPKDLVAEAEIIEKNPDN